MRRCDLISVLKSQQWEKCKGELNAFVALEGSKMSDPIPKHLRDTEETGFEKITKLVEEFILSVEHWGLHE